jgi:hypothetical protein
MSSHGDLRKQLSQVFNTIKAQGYRFEEVMPGAMQDHLHDMIALKEAQAYIKEMGIREKTLQDENASLLAKLKVKQVDIDDQPEEVKALKVDLQQAQHQIDYYKGLADHAQIRAERYQRKLAETSKSQIAANDDARRMQRLERDIADREVAMFKLLEENRNMTNLYETQREQDKILLQEKDDTIVAMVNHAKQLVSQNVEAIDDQVKVSEAQDALIDTLEENSITATEAFNRNSAKLLNQLRESDQLHSAIASELKPLHFFYESVLNILGVYQSIFHDLSDSSVSTMPTIPQILDASMDTANDELYSWQHMSTDLHAHCSVQGEVLRQVDDMANVAARMYTGLESMKDVVSGFLDRLHNDPKGWVTAKSRCTRSRKAPTTPRISMNSPPSSVSSITSFVKRFSMA